MRKKIQRSMVMVLAVTLLLSYIILTLITYNRNLDTLESEVRQEAKYIQAAINISGAQYLEEMDGVDWTTRVTQIDENGDVLYVADFSRLARNVRDLLSIAELLKENKVRLVSLKENIDTDTANGKLMFTLIGAIAEFERENLLERQREGIEIAKTKGVYKGRKKKEAADFEKYYALYQKREITKKKMAELLKVSRPTLDRMIREYSKKSA